MKKLLTIIITFAMSLQTALAINVQGRVLDKETLEPLHGAVLLALSNNKILASVESNKYGEFKIELKKGKTLRLEVVRNGYKTENATIEIDQAFIAAKPFITIHLQSKHNYQKTQSVKKDKTIIEDIGDLSELPTGYKIIEAVPIKEQEENKSRYNVKAEVSDQTTNVNVDVLKTEFNKEMESDALNPNHNFTTSYYKEGNIFYNVAKAFLSQEVKKILKDIALRLKGDNKSSLKMNVFADANKEAKIGEYISKMRAEEVVNLMISEGVDFKQLEINIIGNEMLRNDCTNGVKCTEEQHQENRKIELTFVKE